MSLPKTICQIETDAEGLEDYRIIDFEGWYFAERMDCKIVFALVRT
jgi:hypothetical protein